MRDFFAAMQEIICAGEPAPKPATCRGCSGTGEKEDGSACMWCDPSGDVPDVTPEDVAKLKAVQKKAWGF